LKYTIKSQLLSFCTYIICPQTHVLGKARRVHTYSDEDIFVLLNSHHQELTLSNLDEIWKQSKEAEESESEPKEGTVMIAELTEGLDTVKLAS
jgi:hypothetical protein